MISLIILICAIQTKNLFCILITTLFLIVIWSHIINAIKSNNLSKKNPIDKHMDDNYADINWLKNKKL